MIRPFREFLFKELSGKLPDSLDMNVVGYPTRDMPLRYVLIHSLTANRGNQNTPLSDEIIFEVTFMIVENNPNWLLVSQTADAIFEIFAVQGKGGFCSDNIEGVWFVRYEEIMPNEIAEDAAQGNLTLAFQFFKEIR